VIIVVVPVFNEEKTIQNVINKVSSFCDYVIAVNDASTDNTGELLNSLENKKLIILENDKNLGIGGATKKGIKKALEKEADIIVKFDADGQHLPEDLPKFIEQIKENNYDFVKGNRFKFSVEGMPIVKLLGNLIATNLQKVVTGNFKLSDPNNGFIAFKSEIFDFVKISNLRDDYFFENSFLMNLNIFRFKVTEVPIKTIYGEEKSSIPLIRGSIKLIPVFLKLLYKKNYLNLFQNLSLGSVIFFIFNFLTIIKLTNTSLISTAFLLILVSLYLIIEVINFLNE
tara:strand:+ start:15008 stop:15859 length:852 start_codon:yes stop_codon:yes gene_type:complete